MPLHRYAACVVRRLGFTAVTRRLRPTTVPVSLPTLLVQGCRVASGAASTTNVLHHDNLVQVEECEVNSEDMPHKMLQPTSADRLKQLFQEVHAVQDPLDPATSAEMDSHMETLAMLDVDLFQDQLANFITAVAKTQQLKTEARRAPALERQERLFVARMDRLVRKKLKRNKQQDSRKADELLMFLIRWVGYPELLHERIVALGASLEDGDTWDSNVEIHQLPDAGRNESHMEVLKPRRRRRWADVEVQWKSQIQSTNGNVPDPHRTVILGNLPLDCTKEDVGWALSGCGHIETVEMCGEWDEQYSQDQRVEARPGPKRSGLYAVVTFSDPSGKCKALRRGPRTFGIVMQTLEATGTQVGAKIVGWPTYPQDSCFKTSLLLTRVPWAYSLQEVLSICGRMLAGLAGSGPCELKVLNAQLFTDGVRPFQSLVIKANGEDEASVSVDCTLAEVDQAPDFMVSSFKNDGNIVLRFRSFAEAYLARRCLMNLRLGPREVKCGFWPQRLVCYEANSNHERLDTPHFLDLPVPPSSSCYKGPHLDPILRFGIPMAVFEASGKSLPHK